MNCRTLMRPALIATLIIPATASAQIPGLRDIRETAQEAAEQEILAEVDEQSRNAVRCAFDNFECIRSAEGEGQEVVLTDHEGNVLTDESGQPISDPSQIPPGPTGPAPGETDPNYDFVPGDRVLFADDFSDDAPGDFPRKLDWIRGTMEVVAWEGQRFLLASAENSQFAIPVSGGVPEQFTIEFDIHDPTASAGTKIVTTTIPENGIYEGAHFNYGHWRGMGIWRDNEPLSVVSDDGISKGVVTARIMVDGQHVKAYVNETRVANAPRVELERGDRITFVMHARSDRPIYIGDIRVAAGGKDLYDALEREGRVAVRDILFDTDSATIRPESSSVLEGIGAMMQEHADLTLLIEGHTDSEGDFDHNMQLSADRAASVKAYLVEHYGISSERLRTMGLGPTQPVDTNDTPEGRQKNRRVELVKI